MAREFKIGDVVELRSGGPAMTVMGNEADEADEASTRLLCSLFVGGEMTTRGFEPDVLTMSEHQDTLRDVLTALIASWRKDANEQELRTRRATLTTGKPSRFFMGFAATLEQCANELEAITKFKIESGITAKPSEIEDG